MAAAYDCAIIGGGLAGLSLAILLARDGHKVILFEKETYPFHKVCGEYISNESVPFLQSLGVDLAGMHLPHITSLLLSSPSGISVKRPLSIGGTGLSRYVLDEQLCDIAEAAGVAVRTGIKVQQVQFSDDRFVIKASAETVTAKVAAGAYGKNSNIDAQLGRKYKAPNDDELFVGVKHHIRAEFDSSVVEMHSFPGGYCGMSAIEDGKVNLSYISKARNLKAAGSIPAMEKQMLSRNPFLKKYFDTATFLFARPVTISHVYFQVKAPVADDIIMIGDAAGSIAPASGNGMSMALKSSLLAFRAVGGFLQGAVDRPAMLQQYTRDYYAAFTERIKVSRQINTMLTHPAVANFAFRAFRLFPWLIDMQSKRMHGDPF